MDFGPRWPYHVCKKCVMDRRIHLHAKWHVEPKEFALLVRDQSSCISRDWASGTVVCERLGRDPSGECRRARVLALTNERRGIPRASKRSCDLTSGGHSPSPAKEHVVPARWCTTAHNQVCAGSAQPRVPKPVDWTIWTPCMAASVT